MPKPLTEVEKTAVTDSLYNAGILLLHQKSLKSITVEDITSSAGIAKGTFYVYYTSKEEFQYALLKRSESKLMDRIIAAANGKGDLKDKVIFIFKDVFLAKDSVAFLLTLDDIQYLLEKLPKKNQFEHQKARTNLERMFSALGISTAKCKDSTLAYLSDCVFFVASSNLTYYDEKGKQQTLDILINAIADYIAT